MFTLKKQMQIYSFFVQFKLEWVHCGWMPLPTSQGNYSHNHFPRIYSTEYWQEVFLQIITDHSEVEFWPFGYKIVIT